jgi:hypothetical protein
LHKSPYRFASATIDIVVQIKEPFTDIYATVGNKRDTDRVCIEPCIVMGGTIRTGYSCAEFPEKFCPEYMSGFHTSALCSNMKYLPKRWPPYGSIRYEECGYRRCNRRWGRR